MEELAGIYSRYLMQPDNTGYCDGRRHLLHVIYLLDRYGGVGS